MASDTKSHVASLVSRHIDMMSPRRKMREIAERMGFKKPNMLSMIRTGRAAVPFEKIPVIARELEIDPSLLLRLHLKEVWPGFDNVVDEVFGGILTTAERKWLSFFKEIGFTEPPDGPEQKVKFADAIRKSVVAGVHS